MQFILVVIVLTFSICNKSTRSKEEDEEEHRAEQHQREEAH